LSIAAGLSGERTPNIFAKVIKKADETRNNNNVMTDDSELKFNVNPNKTYFLWEMMRVNSVINADFQYQLKIPSGTARKINENISTQVALDDRDFTTPSGNIATSGADQFVLAIGVIEVGVTGGEVVLQWAQNISDAGNTIMRKGSFLVVYEE